MGDSPTLEIVSDISAFIIRGDRRIELKGGIVRDIIANYRHCLTHERGETDAALYLWGVISGMQHENARMIEVQLADFKIRHKRIVE